MISVVLVTSLASEDEHDYSLSTFSSHESREVTPYVPRESPIDSYESPSDTLPELIIEVEKKYQYDEPKEVYDKLDKSMANLYKKYILKIDDGTSSVDSIVERYEAEMHNDDERNIERSVEEELERPVRQDTNDENDDAEIGTDEEGNSNASPEKVPERDVTHGGWLEWNGMEWMARSSVRQDTNDENDDTEMGTDEEGNGNASPEKDRERDVTHGVARRSGLSPVPEESEDFFPRFSRISLQEGGQKSRETASRSYLQVTEGSVEVSIKDSTQEEGRPSDSLAKTTDASNQTEVTATPETMRRKQSFDIIPIKRTIHEDLHEFTPPTQASRMTLVETAEESDPFENTTRREDGISPNEDRDVPISPLEGREVSPCFKISGRAKATSHNRTEDRQDTDNENDDSENGTDEEGNDNGSPENKAEGDVIYRTAKVPGLSPIQEVREDFSRISLYEGQQARERASRSYLQVTEGRGEASINGSIRDEGRASDSLAKTTDASKETEVTATPEAMRFRRSSRLTDIIPIKRTIHEELHDFTPPAQASRMTLVETAEESDSIEDTTGREDSISPNEDQDVPISPREDRVVSPCFPISGRAKATSYHPTEDRQDTDNENNDSENGTDEDGNSNGSPEKETERDVIYRLSPIPEEREDISRISSYEDQKGRGTASRSYLHATQGVEVTQAEERASYSFAKTTDASKETVVTATPEAMRRRRSSKISPIKMTIFEDFGFTPPTQASRMTLVETAEESEESDYIENTTVREHVAILPIEDQDVRISPNEVQDVPISPNEYQDIPIPPGRQDDNDNGDAEKGTGEEGNTGKKAHLLDMTAKKQTIRASPKIFDELRNSPLDENEMERDFIYGLARIPALSPIPEVTEECSQISLRERRKRSRNSLRGGPEIARSSSSGGQEITESLSSGHQEIARRTSSGGQVIARSSSSRRPEIARSSSSGGQEIAKSSSSGRPEIARSSSSGGQEIAKSSSSGRPEIDISSSSGGQEIAKSSSSGRPEIAGGQKIARSSSSGRLEIARSSSSVGQEIAKSSSCGGQEIARSSSSERQTIVRSSSSESQEISRSSSSGGQEIAKSLSSGGQKTASQSYSYVGEEGEDVSVHCSTQDEGRASESLAKASDASIEADATTSSLTASGVRRRTSRGTSIIPAKRTKYDESRTAHVENIPDVSPCIPVVRREVSGLTFTPLVTSSPESPLSELITEVEEKRVNDESEEFYEDLERMMVKLYRKYILKNDHLDSDDSAVRKYSIFGQPNLSSEDSN
ncbi:serine-rich adhesin for platelets-like [Maniola hyperantus]|uniref:serine-rich adhesin for platelets-like n=1 Tax=Aphantopus hyperantus TaxID=2795564 RepID=UPI003749EA9C